jgi:hypothetical protein
LPVVSWRWGDASGGRGRRVAVVGGHGVILMEVGEATKGESSGRMCADLIYAAAPESAPGPRARERCRARAAMGHG